MRYYNKLKNIISIIFIIILSAQIFILGYFSQQQKVIENNTIEISSSKNEVGNYFIKDIIRQEERQVLKSIRQSWIQFLSSSNMTVLQKENDKYLFSNKENQTIKFDNETMIKSKNVDGYYTIYDKEKREVLLDNCYPQWNKPVVNHILNIIAAPVKVFGETGEILIFDSNTGEIVYSSKNKFIDNKKIFDENNVPNISLLHNIINNQNTEQVNKVIESLKDKTDTQRSTEITSLLYDRVIYDECNINNYNKYPFGSANRAYIEKIILPYESIGAEGLNMQLTVAIEIQEQELYSAFKQSDIKINNLLDTLLVQNEVMCTIPKISIYLSLVSIITTLIFIRIAAYEKEKKGD